MIPIHINYVGVQTVKEYFAWAIYAFIFLILIHRINIKKFIQYYLVVSLLSAAFLIVQFLIHQTTGRWISLIIPNFKSSYGVMTNELVANIRRPSSFFSEPAHYVQYASIPFLAVLFKEVKSKKDILSLIVIGVSIALTNSGNGLLVIILSLMCLIVNELHRKKIVLLLLLVFAVTTVLIFLFNYSKSFNTLINRIIEVTEDPKIGHLSGYVRVVRGYIGFINLPIFSKIFGIGIGVYHNLFYTDFYSVLSAKTDILLDYLNGTQYYLISLGLIGYGSFLISCVYCFYRGSCFKKSAIVVLIGLMCVAAVYSRWVWLFFLLVIFVGDQETNNYSCSLYDIPNVSRANG